MTYLLVPLTAFQSNSERFSIDMYKLFICLLAH